MHPWHDIDVNASTVAQSFPVVVEIRKGNKNKYELDERTGLLRMRDDKGVDDKIIAVSVGGPSFADHADASQFPAHIFREMRRFCEDDKALENKRTVVDAVLGPPDALAILRDALDLYRNRRAELVST